MAVTLAEILQKEQVVLDLQAQTLEAALGEIIATMTANRKVPDAEQLLVEVLTRETSASTFVGNGVAFPHARTDLVTQIVLGIGRSLSGVQFGAEDERAHLLFVIAVPRRMATDYLVCVGALARLTSERGTREALMNATTPSEFATILREGSLVLK